MNRSLIVFVSTFLAAAVPLTSTQAFAEPKEVRDGRILRQRTSTPSDKPIAKPRQATSCAQFGAGFVRAPGSDSCVRIGGGVDVGVGSSR